MSAPKRIWAIADKDARGGRQPCGLWRETEILQDSTDAIFHHKPVEYTRSDLCDPMQDERVKRLVGALRYLRETYSKPDERMCCNGRECGCYGASLYQHAEHCADEALADYDAALRAREQGEG